MLERLTYACTIGDGQANEDTAGLTAVMAWLIDGATDVDPNTHFTETTGARWIADEVDALFRAMPENTEHHPIELAAIHVRERLQSIGFPSDRLPPACSCGMIRQCGETVELSLVGDVFIYSLYDDYLLSNPVFGHNEKAAVARTGSSNGLRDTQALRGIAARRRNYIRGVDDIWVLSNNPSIRDGVVRTILPRQAGNEYLLASDGFARLVEPYGVFHGWKELSLYLKRHGADRAMSLLRSFEDEHATDTWHFKARDDACVILVADTADAES
jgi:hypothetical protein